MEQKNRNDILQEIPMQQWPKVQNMLKKNWPRGICMYYLIENFIRWNNKGFPVQFSVYCPNGGYSDGTIIVTFRMGLLNCIHLYTMEKNCKRLKDALLKTSIIDWSEGPFFYAIHSEHWPHIQEVINSLKFDYDFQLQSECHMISKENSEKYKIKCPEGVHLGPLEIKHAHQINELWTHRYPGSEEFITALITNNVGIGLFTNGDNKLVSWILKNQMSALDVLQTLNGHQRKGYAELLVKILSKRLIEEGHDVFTYFVKVNGVSEKLFKKLNFELVDNLFFYKVTAK